MSTWQRHAVVNPIVNNALKPDEASERLGEIDHTAILPADFGKLFNQPDYSDVELIIESEHFYAHRAILAARSEYFRALLYGGLRESQHENHAIEIKECKATAFKILLLYIYTGQINIHNENEDILLDLLGLVHQYRFEQLEYGLSKYIQSILSLNNVCLIYDTACFYQLDDLREHCARFIDNHAEEIIKTTEFLELSPEALALIIARDSFYCPEIDIFYAVKNWHEYYYETNRDHQRKPFENIVSNIRLTLISMHDLLKIVRFSNLFDLNLILDAIDLIYTQKNLSTDRNNQIIHQKNRGRLRLNENIATKVYDAQVIEGEMKQSLLDGDVSNYDLDRGYTRHLIDDTHSICIKLDVPSIINHIRLLLWDKDTRAYSYYVEVSIDNENWTRVIDYREYLCRSWQKLYFPPIVVSFIRVVGTHNTVNRVFHLVAMELYYVEKSFALVESILAPLENMATIESGAVVCDGVSRIRNALINGDYQSYDWDTGYTCHQIGSGGIVVQLCQPFIASSMRLLLWDCDTRAYSYYIETSCDNVTWSTIVDNRNVACRSWQILTFAPRIIVYVRICGTHNTANEVFHCVHFECPCKPDVLKAYMKEQQSASNISFDEDNSVTYQEFYDKYESLLDSVNNNSVSTTNRNSTLGTHSILPFTIKANSTKIFHNEEQDK